VFEQAWFVSRAAAFSPTRRLLRTSAVPPAAAGIDPARSRRRCEGAAHGWAWAPGLEFARSGVGVFHRGPRRSVGRARASVAVDDPGRAEGVRRRATARRGPLAIRGFLITKQLRPWTRLGAPADRSAATRAFSAPCARGELGGPRAPAGDSCAAASRFVRGGDGHVQMRCCNNALTLAQIVVRLAVGGEAISGRRGAP